MVTTPRITLNDGTSIPQIGFGVFQVPADQVVTPVVAAIETGYRLIDTAAAYGNEEGVGQAIANSDVPRDDLYITTKLGNDDHGYDKALAAFDASLAKLGLDTVDLYLIHWPLPNRDLYVDTWKAFEKILADGRARSIGVSNFNVEHLERLAGESGVVPVVNQIELHPRFAQAKLRAYNAQHGIATEAWSPIGQGKGLLDDDVVAGIAKAQDRSPAQVVLRWHIQLGDVVIPKSVNPDRIRENIEVFDFELSSEEMDQLSELGPEDRVGPDPATFDPT
ncbi:MAG: aldo/keto reductase [Actinomycetota bacterium]|nr:aldo/keto reductase [Actinomycetota bacterium]